MILSLLPILLLVGLLSCGVWLFGAVASYGPNQISLVIATAAAALIGIVRGQPWDDIQQGLVEGVKIGLAPIMILLAVGALIGSWIVAGTVPAMIYYGVALLKPSIFFAASALICALASISIGSSWTVAGTLGIGLMGIAHSYGLSPAVTAGAVISGAYFGDKLSPLSDTTNLAAAVTGVELFDHIRHMLWTTLPAFLLALVVFALIGADGARAPQEIAQLRQSLDAQFTIGPHLLLPLLIMLVLVARRFPAYPAILLSTAIGGGFALVFQTDTLSALAGIDHADSPAPVIQGLWVALFNGYVGTSADSALNDLLSKGGMSSMLNTVWLIITALAFGGVLERTGILQQILDAALARVKSTGDLILVTVGAGITTNALAADQFLAIALPGRVFSQAYDDRALSRLNLSRTLEDSATLTSVLFPWNTCGAYMSATLGVATMSYLPYAVFNIACPVVAVIYGYSLIAQKPREAPAL